MAFMKKLKADDIWGILAPFKLRVFCFASKNRQRKGKATPVTGCEMSRLPHLLESRFIDGGEVSLTCPLPFTHIRISGRG
jgi:hypothetical protein